MVKRLEIVAMSGLLWSLAVVALAASTAVPPLVLQYDFFEIQKDEVSDGSGHGYVGILRGGRIVPGRRKPAVQLDGTGMVSTDALGRGQDLAGRAMTVGAMCRPLSADGVVLSMGDANDGFSLYLKDGFPHFAVRVKGELHEVEDTEPLELDQWVHLAGVIEPSGELALLVNAFPVSKAAGPALLARTPSGSLLVGGAGASAVGSHSALGWQGLLEDIRMYGGALSREFHRELLGDWANRPGCGCK